jgi:protocatechuate 3,4-dioxygenase beta subunit
MGIRAALVLGLVAVVAVLALVFGPGLPRTPEPPEDPESEALAPKEEATEPPAPPPIASVEGSASWRIVGRILGPDPDAAEATSVRVIAIGPAGWSPKGEVLGGARPDGSFELDVSSLFTGKVQVADLEVQADHPDFLPSAVRASVAEDRREYRVEISLVRAAVVTGRVVDETGVPVENAGVSTYEFRDGKPGRDSVERTRTGPGGTYRLRAVGNETHLIVAAAEGFRPDQAVVSAVTGEKAAVPDLVLRTGVEITGVVRESGRPVPAASVEAYLANLEHTLNAAEHQLTWSAGRLEIARAAATTDDEGRYVLAGLVGETYRIRAKPGPGDPAWVDLRRFPRREVTAPAAGVDFDLPGSRLVVELQAGGKPLAAKHYMVVAHGTFYSVQTDGEGRTGLVCNPEAELTLTVRHGGFEEHESEIVAPEDARERHEVIELQPLRPRPCLVVTLRSPRGAEPVSEAGFGWFRVEGTDFQRSFPEFHRDVKGEDGRFRLADLEPGRWRVVVRPGGEYYGGRAFFLEEELRVDLPTEGEIEREIPVRTGGRLRLSARDEAGRYLGANVAIRDAGNAELPIDLAFRQRGIASFGGSQLQKGECEVLRALPPGWYEVELNLDGYRTVVVPVEIEAGKTAEIQALLEERR